MGKKTTNNMPTSSKTISVTKSSACDELEQLSEIRRGIVNMSNSFAGVCNDPDSSNYGRMWALLDTEKGPVQYSGSVGKGLKKMSTNFEDDEYDSKSIMLVTMKQGEGYEELRSRDLPLQKWGSSQYRSSRCNRSSKKGKKKSKKACMRSSKCSW